MASAAGVAGFRASLDLDPSFLRPSERTATDYPSGVAGFSYGRIHDVEFIGESQAKGGSHAIQAEDRSREGHGITRHDLHRVRSCDSARRSPPNLHISDRVSQVRRSVRRFGTETTPMEDGNS
jgi:hypothetical protein